MLILSIVNSVEFGHDNNLLIISGVDKVLYEYFYSVILLIWEQECNQICPINCKCVQDTKARPIIHSFVRSFIHSNPSYSNARSKGRLVQADGLSHTEEYAIRYRRKINVPQ